MDNIYTRFTCRLIDKHLVPDPTQLTSIDHVCDMSDTQATVCQILEQQRNGNYILVVTDSQDICNLVLAFNPTLKDHKISVLCNDDLHADDAIAEFDRLEKLLHTESGIEYFPSEEIEEGLFEAETGQLLFNYTDAYAKSDENTQLLYTSDGQLWGYVLPYTAAHLVGKLRNHLESLTLSDRTSVAVAVLNCFKEERLSDSIFLFKTENGPSIQPVGVTTICSGKDLYVLLYEIYFSHAPSKDRMLTLIEDRINHAEYPSSLFEFFEYAFADKIYPGLSCKAAALDLLENTLYRMTWVTAKEV